MNKDRHRGAGQRNPGSNDTNNGYERTGGTMKRMWQRAGIMGATLAASGSALAEYAYNLQVPASQVAEDVFRLHNLIMLVCLGIFVVVFGAMFYSLIKHRKSAGHKAAHFHENTTVEAMREAMIGQVQQVKQGFNVYKQRLQAAAPKPTPAASPATGHQQPVITPPAEPEPAKDFRSEWINLTQKGFSTYVFKNLDRFKAIDAVTRADAVAKWKKLYPQNPPPFAVVENATPETHGEGQGEAITPQDVQSGTPNAVMRAKLISECRSYGPAVYTEAKKAMGVSERDADWPPSISGMSRMLDECIRVEEAMKG